MDHTTSQESFAAYVAYRQELATALLQVASGSSPYEVQAAAHLDGWAYQRLRKDVPLNVRRVYSTFFTSSQLRARLVAPYSSFLASGVSVLDPSCGVGDLLLAASALLPRDWDAATLRRHVRTSFYGRELVPILAEITRDRLELAIRVAANDRSAYSPTSFPLITQGDGLDANVPYSDADLILLNPPFGRTILPNPETWGEGLTSQAAVFTVEALRRSNADTRVAAILPDVLRSGTSYSHWRREVESLAQIKTIEVVGLFDPWTDVDVFLAHFLVRPRPRKISLGKDARWHPQLPQLPNFKTLADIADVCIGDVVPHRHAESGPLVPYLSVQSVPVGATLRSAPYRQFAGRLHKAPFVVVRRTSAPTRGKGPRLATSIVDSSLGQVAVENHLIIIKPRSSDTSACQQLSDQLGNPSVTDWLNARVGTRHITKQAMLELPLFPSS